MAGADQAGRTDVEAPRVRLPFNPVWAVDALGVLGAAAWGWSVSGLADPGLSFLFAPARDLGLLFVASALVINALDWILRHRDSRNDARRDLLRRLGHLNDSLLELRKSLSRDHTRCFLERRGEFAQGARLAGRWLSEEEDRLAGAAQAFCERVTQILAETVHHRVGIVTLASRLVREMERAARRGDIELHDADNLTHLIEDSVRVMDEGVYAEWNTDHFGRLGADRAAFEREIARYKSQLADRIELHGLDLFDRLFAHMERKVQALDLIAEWETSYRRLEARLAGYRTAPELVVANPPAPKPPRISERFVSRELPDEVIDTGFPRARRLPAAND